MRQYFAMKHRKSFEQSDCLVTGTNGALDERFLFDFDCQNIPNGADLLFSSHGIGIVIQLTCTTAVISKSI